jgi:hypothetical protein
MRNLFVLGSVLVVTVACGGSDDGGLTGDNTPYTSDPGKTVVVGGAGSGAVSATPSGQECVTLASGECVKPQTQCKDTERADVIVDSAGKVVSIVCYPADANPTPVDAGGNLELGKGNKEVVSVAGQVTGNVTSSGNNVTVYGDGPDASIIGGNVTATGNNFAMRGVTVKGNVEVTGGNNAVLVLCRIEGNVRIVGNNNVIAQCDILGDLTIEGVNNVIVANHVGGTISVSDAKNLVCDGNTAWSDANSNKVFDAGEAGAALTCTNKK